MRRTLFYLLPAVLMAGLSLTLRAGAPAATQAAPSPSVHPAVPYAVLYGDEHSLYLLGREARDAVRLGGDTAVPPGWLAPQPGRIAHPDHLLDDISLTPGYTFVSALESPSKESLVYVEAQCDQEECEPVYHVWLVDRVANRRDLLTDESGSMGALLPEPVAWDEAGGAILFDTVDVVHHMPFAGLWRFDLDGGAAIRVDLGDGYYNSRFWLSPDGDWLLTTGSATETIGPATGRASATSQVKIVEVESGKVHILAERLDGGEFFVRGWLLSDQYANLAALAGRPGPLAADEVAEAASGFQRPMVNDHFGWHWEECTDTYNGCPPKVLHPGLDYNGPGAGNADCGSNIYAIADGVVRYVNLGGWGTMLIEHLWKGTTVYSQYGHVSTALVAKGQRVNKGQHIAEMGNVGTGTCHLHWEVRRANHPDPLNGGYWDTDVLSRRALVESYYANPEWWVDNHGPYATTPTATPTPAPSPTPSPTATPNVVTLFSGSAFTGTPIYSGAGGFSNAPRADARSLLIPDGWTVKTWRADDRAGGERCWEESIPDLQPYGWERVIESLEVFPNEDRCPPAGVMKAPRSQNYLAGPVVTVSAAVTDRISGIERVEFFAWLDTEWTLIGWDDSSPYEIQWDVSDLSEGGRWVSANLIDRRGNRSGLLWEPHWGYLNLDHTAPESAVRPLPPSQAAMVFSVQWAGTDNMSDPGFLTYEVEYQIGCVGHWRAWLAGTTHTSANFTGQPNTRFCFRSRARDQAGNLEEWPAQADAQTSVGIDRPEYKLFLPVLGR